MVSKKKDIYCFRILSLSSTSNHSQKAAVCLFMYFVIEIKKDYNNYMVKDTKKQLIDSIIIQSDVQPSFNMHH